MKGRVALVTGASSGIGAAASQLLAEHGAIVCMTGRNVENLEKIATKIRNSVGNDCKVACIAGDVCSEDDVEHVVKESVAFGKANRLDILVNCAGVLEPGATGIASMENWDKNFNVNARGV